LKSYLSRVERAGNWSRPPPTVHIKHGVELTYK
jgi:hypothetical protein